MTTGHLITTPATPSTCRRCSALILAGLSDGVETRADPISLNPSGEATALISGLPTFALTADGMVIRDSEHLRYPAGPVVAAHRCGRAVQPAHRAPPRSPPVAPPATTEPPF